MIEEKHKEIIDIAKDYMNSIKDNEHNTAHMIDVVNYTKELLEHIDADKEVCIISAYWHDTGRAKLNEGHEKLSSEMLEEELRKRNYNEDFIIKCKKAIENHKWNMTPETIEGLIIKDADKLAWLGKERWTSCLNAKQELNDIIILLPQLRDNILHFEESKRIYDRDIINLVNILYNNIYK